MNLISKRKFAILNFMATPKTSSEYRAYKEDTHTHKKYSGAFYDGFSCNGKFYVGAKKYNKNACVYNLLDAIEETIRYV